jgi:hypothetical protein
MQNITATANFSRFSAAILETSVQRFAEVINSDLKDDAYLQLHFNEIARYNTQLHEYVDLKIGRANPLTGQLVKCSDSRKDNLTALENISLGYSQQKVNAELAQTGTIVYTVVKSYIYLKYDGYASAHSNFSDFLREMATPEITAALRVINLQFLVDAIRDLSTKFEELYKARIDDAAPKVGIKKVQIKKNITAHLEASLNHIDGNATLKIPVYISVIPKVNEILNDAMRKYKLEKAKNVKPNDKTNNKTNNKIIEKINDKPLEKPVEKVIEKTSDNSDTDINKSNTVVTEKVT